jgi:hypothetical protein
MQRDRLNSFLSSVGNFDRQRWMDYGGMISGHGKKDFGSGYFELGWYQDPAMAGPGSTRHVCYGRPPTRSMSWGVTIIKPRASAVLL